MAAWAAWSNFACTYQRSGMTGGVIFGSPISAGVTSWHYAQPAKSGFSAEGGAVVPL